MARQRFEIEHLRAARRKRLQQPALAAAGGPADHAVIETQRQIFQLDQHRAPITLIAAFQRGGVPADFAQDVRHGGGTFAAAPAIDQRFPLRIARSEVRLDMPCHVLRNQCRADLARLERRHLLVNRADACALLIVERRTVHRAGNMIDGEFRGRTHIDDFVEIFEFRHSGTADLP